MARLNPRPASTPQPGRASTVDSLYRDPSTAPRHDRNARQPTNLSTISPTQSMSSDKENDVPDSRATSPRPVKSRRMAPTTSGRLPTPDSASGNAHKRRRTGDYDLGDGIYRDEDAQDQFEEEDENLKYYNPNQDPEQRRVLRAGIRNNQRELEENRDELVQAGDSRLLEQVHKQNVLFGKVRQTAEATLDSHFLVYASDLASKKLNNSLHGNTGVGIDIDQFVSKCIFFMKSGGQTAGAEGGPVAPVADDDEDGEEDGDGLDWALLGREACFPSNKRPPVSSFLLGPLSVQKRVRATQRRARSQRQPVGPVTRPQEIQEADIRQSENSNLTHLVRGIEKHLKTHIKDASDHVEKELSDLSQSDEVEDEDYRAACKRFRICQAPTEEAAVSLLDFAINPRSFGQTVENLFYISFLIREGNAKIMFDSDGLPLLVPEKPRNISEQREQSIQKNQAVFSIDWPTWQDFITAFDIRESLIPHRQEEQATVAPGGWYG